MPTQIPNHVDRTDEIQEIIGQVPGWITRWGITVLFLMLLLVVFISRYLTLPVTIQAEVNFHAKEQPFRFVWMKTETNVDYTPVVKDGQFVSKEDTVVLEINRSTGAKTYHTTSIGGKVMFFRGTEEMPRASGLIVTPQFTNYDIEIKVPIDGSGQIRKGQKTLIRLDEFPEHKYGFLIGEVAELSYVPIDRFYRGRLYLSNGMLTNVHQNIPLMANLHGKAQIITENISVFDKIFGGLF
ncbi:hypothetical protein [Emticicia sp. 17c]|uniref:hypothetical protein n=1 Tax=Emticicia sp. 17c TaxID=3127704 RepID=UPI00301C6F5D